MQLSTSAAAPQHLYAMPPLPSRMVRKSDFSVNDVDGLIMNLAPVRLEPLWAPTIGLSVSLALVTVLIIKQWNPIGAAIAAILAVGTLYATYFTYCAKKAWREEKRAAEDARAIFNLYQGLIPEHLHKLLQMREGIVAKQIYWNMSAGQVVQGLSRRTTVAEKIQLVNHHLSGFNPHVRYVLEQAIEFYQKAVRGSHYTTSIRDIVTDPSVQHRFHQTPDFLECCVALVETEIPTADKLALSTYVKQQEYPTMARLNTQIQRVRFADGNVLLVEESFIKDVCGTTVHAIRRLESSQFTQLASFFEGAGHLGYEFDVVGVLNAAWIAKLRPVLESCVRYYSENITWATFREKSGCGADVIPAGVFSSLENYSEELAKKISSYLIDKKPSDPVEWFVAFKKFFDHVGLPDVARKAAMIWCAETKNLWGCQTFQMGMHQYKVLRQAGYQAEAQSTLEKHLISEHRTEITFGRTFLLPHWEGLFKGCEEWVMDDFLTFCTTRKGREMLGKECPLNVLPIELANAVNEFNRKRGVRIT